MGDFYELFFEDAIEASRALGITLTSAASIWGRYSHVRRACPCCG